MNKCTQCGEAYDTSTKYCTACGCKVTTPTNTLKTDLMKLKARIKWNTVIYLSFAVLPFLGLAEVVGPHGAAKDLGFIIGSFITLCEVGLYKFCFHEERNYGALFAFGFCLMTGVFGFALGNNLFPYVLMCFVAGAALFYWLSDESYN